MGMTKRLLLLVGLSLAGLGGLPAGASADVSFQGACHVTGKATFPGGLTGAPQQEGYDFLSGSPADGVVDGTVCSSVKINGISVPDGHATVSVHATDQLLSCGASAGRGGEGTITLANGFEIHFVLDIAGVASEVALVVNGPTSGASPGHASFQKYVDPAGAAAACNGDGLNDLGFEADFDNTNGPPLVGPGTYPPPESPQPASAAGSGPSSDSGPGTVSNQPSDTSGAPASAPAPQCVVPKLKSKTLKAAKRALSRAHCSLGKVTRKANRRMKKGRISAQKPRPGTRKAAGARVAVVVSKGKR
jgi:hypothetical protein